MDNRNTCEIVMDIVSMTKDQAAAVFLALAKDFPERAAEIEACFWSARASQAKWVPPAQSSGAQAC